ncbi:MAG: extensin family protein, partial [Pseudomonadota bacterium]
ARRGRQVCIGVVGAFMTYFSAAHPCVPSIRVVRIQRSCAASAAAVALVAGLTATVAVSVSSQSVQAQTLRFNADGEIVVVPQVRRTRPNHPPVRGQNAQDFSVDAQVDEAEAIPPDDDENDALPDRATNTAWARGDVAEGRAVCRSLVAKFNAKVTYLRPIKRGRCGSPAPILLQSLGGKADVSFNPPAKVNCQMLAALARWIGEDLQPLARKHLKSRLQSVNVMSDYSCRNVYGRKRGRLSQHARANALDIGGFTTANRRETRLVRHWGPTRRGIRQFVARKQRERQELNQKARARRLAAQRKRDVIAQEKARQGAAAATVASQPPKTPAPVVAAGTSPGALGTAATKTLTQALSIVRGTISPSKDKERPSVLGIGKGLALGLNKLGGPKPSNAPASTATAPTTQAAKISLAPLYRGYDRRRARFLKAAQRSACKHFGTVLGPEYDRTHENHFHVDLARRKHGPFCR